MKNVDEMDNDHMDIKQLCSDISDLAMLAVKLKLIVDYLDSDTKNTDKEAINKVNNGEE